jgi:hopanoid biosynthesis associated protein HpnK
MLDRLSELGYVAVALGAFVEGEAVMLSAGALAQVGKLGLPGVMLAGAAGSFAWGQTWFSVGRVLGPRLLARRPAWQSRAEVVRRELGRVGAWVVVAGRFVAGMGTVLPAVVGASGFPRARFVVLDAAGACLWSSLLAALGFGVGRGLERLVGRPLGYGVALAVLGLLALAFVVMRAFRRRPAEDGRPREPASERSPGSRGERRLVITGDDFGLALPFNEAIELAHRHGVLTTASLMLGESATADAVRRARANPTLCVGLHLALCEAKPVAPASAIPRLVNAEGELGGPVASILRFCLFAPRRRFRRELETEIRAQFRAFAATGLRFDHVSGHNNLHLHPVVLPILMRVAREFGVSAVRVPYEPLVASVRASRTGVLGRFCVWAVMGSWASWAKRRLRAEGFVVNDRIFGVFDCGRMTLEHLLGVVGHLPPGTSEIHVHPATRRCPEIERTTPTYLHEAELEALVSPLLRAALAKNGVRLAAGYAELLTSERSRSARAAPPSELLVPEGPSKS